MKLGLTPTRMPAPLLDWKKILIIKLAFSQIYLGVNKICDED